ISTTSAAVAGNPALPALPVPLAEFATATLPDGRIIIIGGKDNTGNVTSTVTQYDPQTNTFTTLAPLNAGLRRSLGAAAVNTAQGVRVYAFGGYDGSGASVGDTNEYNPQTNTWRGPLTFMPHQLAEFGTAAVFGNNSVNPQDRIFTVCGSDGLTAATANPT